MNREETSEPFELLEHQRFVEALAVRLARDNERAADLVQETWLRALASPPRHQSNVRGWLRRVAHNAFFRSGRQGIEMADVDPDSLEGHASSNTSLERSELLEKLGGEVAKLREPYRTVILKRFFEGKAPRVIAEELNRPVATISNQLHRALEQLRERLDQSYGADRSRWSLLLLPVSGGLDEGRKLLSPRSTLKWSPSALAWWVAGIVGVLTLGGLWWATTERGSSFTALPELAGLPATVAIESGASLDAMSRETVPLERSTIALATAEAPAAQVVTAAPRLEVTVVGDGDAPLQGAIVEVLSSAPQDQLPNFGEYEARSGFRQLSTGHRWTTDSSGQVQVPLGEEHRQRFEQFDPDSEYVAVSVLCKGHVASVLHCVPYPEGSLAKVQVRLEGDAQTVQLRIQDSSGEPVRAHAWLRQSTPKQEPGAALLVPNPRKTQSDSSGLWVHPNVPGGPQLFEIDAAGFLAARVWIEVGPTSVLDEIPVVLERGSGVSGWVSTLEGQACPGAVVWAEIGKGNRRRTPTTRADESGFFHLEGLPTSRSWLYATHPDDPSMLAIEALDLVKGDSQTWNPTLSIAEALALQVVNEEQETLQGCTLYAYLPSRKDLAPWNRVLDPDAQGIVEVLDVPPGEEVVVEVFFSKDDLYDAVMPDWSVRGVRPSSELQILGVPTQSLQRCNVNGLLQSPRGDLMPGLPIYVRGKGRSLFKVLGVTNELGEFTCERLSPGDYEFYAGRPGCGMSVLGELSVEGSGVQDHRFQLEDSLEVRIDWGWPAEVEGITYELIHRCDLGDTTLSWPAIRTTPGPPPASLSLLAGEYAWQVKAKGQILGEGTDTLGSGAQSVLTMKPNP